MGWGRDESVAGPPVTGTAVGVRRASFQVSLGFSLALLLINSVKLTLSLSVPFCKMQLLVAALRWFCE